MFYGEIITLSNRLTFFFVNAKNFIKTQIYKTYLTFTIKNVEAPSKASRLYPQHSRVAGMPVNAAPHDTSVSAFIQLSLSHSLLA